ncbi:phosphorylcholine metabolism protein LicD and glycosyltransferase family 92 domain containing protein [Indivirus ILV1]|uniref:Phosphorylcholine metabolism protein LicD and glycosyltransferase family 92 domain containing protein n=1 Tax=Indivirus ILV1 TaxID=1977633 RepID=A0A1V0SD50_9VIRU|nr:phosphorylcholine metabolism protein LicD and glycosyltransferase family 92 domain containing protein [Indivirus ILV1]
MNNYMLIILIFLLVIYLLFDKNIEEYKVEKHLIINSKDMDKLKQMLYNVDKIFKKNDISYCMNGGTLLGAIRHQGLIPWDDDADLYIMAYDENKFLSLKPILNQQGYDIGYWWGGYKIYLLNGKNIDGKNKDYKFPFIDIFLLSRDKHNNLIDKNKFCVMTWPNSYFTDKEFYPLRPYKFHDFEIMGPHNPIPYLDRMYGKNWRHIAFKTFDHESESHIPKQIIHFDVNKAKKNIDLSTMHISKHKICIVAIFKNEQDYLEEWLIHHIDQGINHFYLYSNDPNMYKYSYLKKYKNYITIIPWVDKKNNGSRTIQRQAYEDCIKNYHDSSKYIMLLDIDEYLFPIIPKMKVIDVINSIDNNDIKSIKVPRYNFGSNGHFRKPYSNIVSSYLKHEKICSSYKTIANLSYVDLSLPFYGVHDFPFLDKPGRVYNEYFDYKYLGYPNGCNKNNKNEIPLVINHYYTKSYDEYLKRCEMWKNGGVNNVGYRKDCKNKFMEEDKNEVSGYDYLIQ